MMDREEGRTMHQRAMMKALELFDGKRSEEINQKQGNRVAKRMCL